MKIKIRYFTFLVLAIFCFSSPSFAIQENAPLVVDNADLLSNSEEYELSQKLSEISAKTGVMVVIDTEYYIGGKSPRDFADDLSDSRGYTDSVVLLLSMAERDWYISTAGFGIIAITDAGRKYMADKFVPYLSDGDYYSAFDKFATLTDEFLLQAKTGRAYDKGHLPKGSFPFLAIPVALLLGAVAGGGRVFAAKSQLKSVARQRTASSYERKNSRKLTDARDVFLYRNISAVPIPVEKNNTFGGGGGSLTHMSSGGVIHGGGGGKF